MQKAVPVGKGKMIAVLGTKIKDIKDLLRLNVDSSICEIANDNADGQVIISGDKETIDNFQSSLKEKKLNRYHLK